VTAERRLRDGWLRRCPSAKLGILRIWLRFSRSSLRAGVRRSCAQVTPGRSLRSRASRVMMWRQTVPRSSSVQL